MHSLFLKNKKIPLESFLVIIVCKITPVEIVQLFKDNLHIIEGRELWQEFYAQLNIKQQETYSKGNKDKNKLVKQALDNDFTNKFNKWIYETKIKQ
jgi:hypothetical protein